MICDIEVLELLESDLIHLDYFSALNRLLTLQQCDPIWTLEFILKELHARNYFDTLTPESIQFLTNLGEVIK